MEKFKPEKKVFSVCKILRVNKTEPNEEREVYLSMLFLSPLFPRPCCDFVSEFVASFADWLEATLHSLDLSLFALAGNWI